MYTVSHEAMRVEVLYYFECVIKRDVGEEEDDGGSCEEDNPKPRLELPHCGSTRLKRQKNKKKISPEERKSCHSLKCFEVGFQAGLD